MWGTLATLPFIKNLNSVGQMEAGTLRICCISMGGAQREGKGRLQSGWLPAPTVALGRKRGTAQTTLVGSRFLEVQARTGSRPSSPLPQLPEGLQLGTSPCAVEMCDNTG